MGIDWVTYQMWYWGGVVADQIAAGAYVAYQVSMALWWPF